MTALRLVFGGFLVVELAAAVTFLVLYLPRSDWSRNAVGRHLAAYGTVLSLLLAITLASLIWHGHFFLFGSEIVAHALFAFTLWQRVWLVAREQHDTPDEAPRDADDTPSP